MVFTEKRHDAHSHDLPPAGRRASAAEADRRCVAARVRATPGKVSRDGVMLAIALGYQRLAEQAASLESTGIPIERGEEDDRSL